MIGLAKSANSYNIKKRDDGRWYLQLMVDGERIHLYGKTKGEVQVKLKQKLWEIEQAKAAKLINFSQAEKVTVEQWARQCLETYCRDAVKPNTYAGYQSILEHHFDGIGSMKLSRTAKLTPKQPPEDSKSCWNMPNRTG